MVETICDFCGEPVQKTAYQIKKYKHHFCDSECQHLWRSSKDKIDCICAWCGSEFRRKKSQVEGRNNIFCSTACYGKWKSKYNVGKNNPLYKERVKVVCDQCGKEFHVHASKKKWFLEGKQKNIFCSKQCRYEWDSIHFAYENNPNYSEGKFLSCVWCQKEFWARPYDIKRGAKYCSIECKHEHFSKVLSKTKEWRKLRREIAVKTMKNAKQSDTRPERLVRQYLDEHKIKYISQHGMYDRYVVDFYLPKQDLIIEVNGDFWHRNPKIYTDKSKLYPVQIKNMNKDKAKLKFLKEKGHNIMVVWENDIYNDINQALESLKNKIA